MSGGGIALAVAVAVLVTGLELITSKYPQTPTFVLKSGWFYGYVIIYGLIAGGVAAILPLIPDQVTISGLSLENPWIKAAVIGFSIKAFLHIRLFSVSTGPGSDPFPVGIETIVQLFEPWMLRSLQLDHWNKLQTFVAPRAGAFPTVADASARALANIPAGTEPALRAAFNADISAAGTQSEVIIVYMRYFGTAACRRVFP
jgi:hypothetical protein